MKITLYVGEYYGHGYKLREPEEMDLEEKEDDDGDISHPVRKLSIHTFYLLWMEVYDSIVEDEIFDLDVSACWEIKLSSTCVNPAHRAPLLIFADNGESWKCVETKVVRLGFGKEKESMFRFDSYEKDCFRCRRPFLNVTYIAGDESHVNLRLPVYLVDVHIL